MQNYNIYPKTHIWLCTKKPKEATQLWPVLYSRNSLLHPLSFFFFCCEVKVFTLSGSHQQYQSHLCESFSWKCCTSLKYFSLGLRSRKKEKKLHTETFKAILHKRGNPGLRQDFHCQLRHILSSGQTTTQMLRRRKRRRRRQRRGLILLWSSLLFWLGLSSRCVVMERSAKPAGIEDTGWPQPDTEATWS